jgi:FkbM family methyltransferase
MAYVTHPTCQIHRLPELLTQVFGDDYIGSFVEVGAFDGMTYSNTWGLANAGWKGLYLEAHPDFAKQCKLNHKDNHKIEVGAFAVGSEEGNIMLTVYGEVSTVVLNKWNRQWGMDESTPQIKVPCYKLETLLHAFGIHDGFDLLVIDVEEFEIEVLKGFNLHAHLPKMIVVELHEGQGTGEDQKGWQTPWVDNYLKGYKKIYADLINTIYRREI